jgi:integrase/recombinase XerD
MPKYYYSIYGPLLQRFLEFKRGLGFKYHAAQTDCNRFDRIAMKRKETSIGITKAFANEICIKRPNESAKTRVNWILFIRQFAVFLCDNGHRSHIPKLPKFKSTYTPYIFSKEEMDTIFETCDELKATSRNANSSIFVIPVLFRMLYGTGLRVGEAFNLSCEDVDLKNKCLTLRGCKNGKDRLVPISDSLAAACKDYLKYRSRRNLIKNVDRFFIADDGHPSRQAIGYTWFRKVMFMCGISHGGRGYGPRLHDLRHTFSVHSLASMAEAGVDLYYSLPILSTYLGHTTLAATDNYVRLTAEMYPSLIENVNKISPHLFPDIYKLTEDETN